MPRQRLPKEVRRKSIIDAAIKCFSEKGYHGTSINDIVELSNMSKGNVYWYFSGKEEIFLAVFEDWCEKALDDLTSDFETGDYDFIKVHENVVERMHRYTTTERTFMLAWIEFSTAAVRNEDLRMRLIEISGKFRNKVAAFLSKVEQEGQIKDMDVEVTADLFSVLHDGLVFNSIIWPERFAEKKTLTELMDLVNVLMRAGSGASPGSRLASGE